MHHLKQRRDFDLVAHQVVGGGGDSVVVVGNRYRCGRIELHLGALEPFVAGDSAIGRRRAGENRRPSRDRGRGQNTDRVGRGVRVLENAILLLSPENRLDIGTLAGTNRGGELIVTDAIEGKDQDIGSLLRRGDLRTRLHFSAVQKQTGGGARDKAEGRESRAKDENRPA